MLPVTDRHKISRAKLAYLIDATAAPVHDRADLLPGRPPCPASSRTTTALTCSCARHPHNFYSLLTFVFIIALIP